MKTTATTPAAGRPLFNEERMAGRTVRMTDRLYAEFLRLGGAAWLREKLEDSLERQAKKKK